MSRTSLRQPQPPAHARLARDILAPQRRCRLNSFFRGQNAHVSKFYQRSFVCIGSIKGWVVIITAEGS